MSFKITPSEFAERQASCPSLISFWKKAESAERVTARNGTVFSFTIKDCLLYRTCIKSRNVSDVGRLYLVLPANCTDLILRVSDSFVRAGRLPIRKTIMLIREKFFWPEMDRDIKRCHKACRVCNDSMTVSMSSGSSRKRSTTGSRASRNRSIRRLPIAPVKSNRVK